jgi:hypothetical protein
MHPDRENADPDDPTQGSLSRRFALANLLTAGTAPIPGRSSDAREVKQGIIDASAYGVGAADDERHTKR